MALELAEVVGRLAELHRFPVEPLAGERPNTALLSSGGLVGDRFHEIRDRRTGTALTASGSPRLPLYSARYLEDLVAADLDRWTRVRTPDGREYAMTDPEWLEDLSRAVGLPVAVSTRTPEKSPVRLISRLTLRLAERAYGAPLEPSRVRANLIVEVPEGKAFEEDQWVGRRLRIGEAFLEISDFSSDCVDAKVVQTEDSGGDPDLLAGLIQIHGGHLGVAARVVEGQRVRAGDPVMLVG